MSGDPASRPVPLVDARVEPPSAVWTRQPPAWRAGVRAAVRALGGGLPTLWFLGIRSGELGWKWALAIDVGLAACAGIGMTWWTWARRARLAEMLDSPAVLPWFLGASAAFVGGMRLWASAVPRLPYGLLMTAAGVVAAAAWTSAWLVRWGRRQGAPAVGAATSSANALPPAP